MLRISRLIFVTLLCVVQCGYAQESASEKRNGVVDVGINITSILSTFVGNDGQIEATDVPFFIRLGKKRKFRIGLGARVRSDQSFDVISQATRTVEERSFLTRLGFQSDIYKRKKWGVYWGVDAIGSLTIDQVKSFFGFGSNRIVLQTIGVGAGPFWGLTFNITDRFYLSTEASLYSVLYIVQDKERGIGLGNTSITTYNFDLQAAPPLFLYVNYAF